MTITLAEALKETARVTEESGIAEEKDHQGNLQMNISIQEAAKSVCRSSLWFPVWLLLDQTWNDALHWAENLEAYDAEKDYGNLRQGKAKPDRGPTR